MENVNSLRLPTVNPIRYLQIKIKPHFTNHKLMLLRYNILQLCALLFVHNWNYVISSRAKSHGAMSSYSNSFCNVAKTYTVDRQGWVAATPQTLHIVFIHPWWLMCDLGKIFFDGDDEHECTCPRPFPHLYVQQDSNDEKHLITAFLSLLSECFEAHAIMIGKEEWAWGNETVEEWESERAKQRLRGCYEEAAPRDCKMKLFT